MVELSEKIMLNQFIAKIGVVYDNENRVYIDNKGNKINNINNYIRACYKKAFNKPIKEEYQAYIERWLYTPYDFENVSYKTYLKDIVEIQSPKKVKDLKDNYSNYLEAIQDNAESKQCIYISGNSGTGKTTYAKILARKFFPESEIFISAGGEHPFDEYYGEKCIIIDDFRDSVMSYNDLLRLLDNNTNSNVGARYHNKNLARCKLIILTSVKSPIELYRGIEEERYQLYRRINYFKVNVEENQVYLNLMQYDKNKENYMFTKFTNITSEMENYIDKQEKKDVVNIEEIFAPKVVDVPEDLLEKVFD